MNLTYVRSNYEFLTAKLSDLTRQLSFAGLAVIWLFKTGEGGAFKFPAELLAPLLLLVLTLCLDWLQYAVGSIIWDRFQRRKESAGTLDSDNFDAPHFINFPASCFFFTKQISLIFAFVFMLSYIFTAWTLR